MTTRLVTIDARQIQAAIAPFENTKNLNKALQAAISRTITTGVAQTARRIGETVHLRIRDIKKQIAVKRPSFNRLVGVMSIKHKAVPLIYYMSAAQIRRASQLKIHKKGKQTRFRSSRVSGGVSVRVRKSGGTERFPESFVERMKSGHQGIFRRKFTGGKRVGRLPIKERMGPTAVGVLKGAPGKGAHTILDEVVNGLGPVLQKNVLSQIDRVLRNEKSFEKFSSYTR